MHFFLLHVHLCSGGGSNLTFMVRQHDKPFVYLHIYLSLKIKFSKMTENFFFFRNRLRRKMGNYICIFSTHMRLLTFYAGSHFTYLLYLERSECVKSGLLNCLPAACQPASQHHKEYTIIFCHLNFQWIDKIRCVFECVAAAYPLAANWIRMIMRNSTSLLAAGVLLHYSLDDCSTTMRFY